MKNKRENAQAEKIMEFVKNNPKCEVATVIQKTGIAKSTVYNILKLMREAGKLNYANKLYTLADEPATIKRPAKKRQAAVVEVVAEEVQEVQEVQEVEEVVAEVQEVEVVADEAKETEETESLGKNFGRDFNKIQFNGQEYRKGKYVHAVLAHHVLTNPETTLVQMNALFPESLVRTFGLFRPIEYARKINNAGKQRYHGRRDMNLTLGCGTQISVTNQISRDNFPGIVEAFKKAGIITEVEYALVD